jgi:hypothetical protein
MREFYNPISLGEVGFIFFRANRPEKSAMRLVYDCSISECVWCLRYEISFDIVLYM